jgi:hypothetical protein
VLQVLPGTEGGGAEKVGVGDRGRNDPNNVCTCEQMNNNKKSFTLKQNKTKQNKNPMF